MTKLLITFPQTGAAGMSADIIIIAGAILLLAAGYDTKDAFR